jgi:hypothetical protein
MADRNTISTPEVAAPLNLMFKTQESSSWKRSPDATRRAQSHRPAEDGKKRDMATQTNRSVAVAGTSSPSGAPSKARTPRGQTPSRSQSPHGKRFSWLIPKRENVETRNYREMLVDEKTQHKAKHVAPKTFEELQTMLKRRYGNLVRAWRLCLDADDAGRLTFNEFGPGLRRIGYEGSIRALWMELDHEMSGAIGLYEISPKLSQLLDRFLQFLQTQFETCEEAWRCFASRGQMALDLKDFALGCTSIHWTEDVQMLHGALDATSMKTGSVKVTDFEWLGMKAKTTVEKIKEHKQKQIMRAVKDVEMRKAPTDVQQFRNMLKRKFGNFLRAWRIALDVDCNFRITFNAFGIALRRLGYAGSIKALWQKFNREDGSTISLVELDMPTAVKLERFKVWMRQTFETSEDAWEAIAHPGQTQVTEERFVEALAVLGWHEDKLTLHRMLDIQDPPSRIIKQEDIDFVGIFDTGVDAGMIDSSASEMFKSEHPFQSLATGFSPSVATGTPSPDVMATPSPYSARKRSPY